MKRFSLLIPIIYLSLITAAHAAPTDTAQNIFFDANKLYANGRYDDAAKRYEQLINGGIRSGNIYYNLANTYFKLGQRGKAIVNYERAKEFIPQDGELFANLNYVTSLLEEAQPEENGTWYEKTYAAVRDAMPIEVWFILAAFFYLAIFFLLIMMIFKSNLRKAGIWITPSLVLIFLISIFMFFGIHDAHKKTRIGVVTVPKVEVRYSPSYAGALAFELHEGIKVRMIRSEGSWSQIRLTHDKSGWVESESIEPI